MSKNAIELALGRTEMQEVMTVRAAPLCLKSHLEYEELEKKYGVTAEAIKKRKDRLLKRLRRKLR